MENKNPKFKIGDVVYVYEPPFFTETTVRSVEDFDEDDSQDNYCIFYRVNDFNEYFSEIELKTSVELVAAIKTDIKILKNHLKALPKQKELKSTV